MRRAAIALLVALLPAMAFGQDRPKTKVADCTTSGCHASEKDRTYVHGPVAVSACDACHEYKDASAHTFKMKREGRDLCAFCHIDKTGTEGPVVHEPFAKGECLGCHDPHGSHTRALLKKDTVNDLCISCHTDEMKGKHAHEPAATNCTSCHQSHTSEHVRLLIKEPKELCLSCHDAVGKTIQDSAHPHKPTEGDCLQCHTPHSTDEIRGLKKAPKDLCVSCHEPVGLAITSAAHQHLAATDGKACLNCHTAHGSEHAMQLKADPVQACLECHKKAIVVDKDRTVGSVADIAVPTLHKHGPVEKGECAACHAVHGGELPDLLQEKYGQGFYQPYSEKAYALCFKCHDRALVESETPDKETGFRNGTQNLHAAHVSKGVQGRSCRACHAPHASRYEKMIADSVSFGQWKLPINFVKTETGGSCMSGCHEPKSYDRVTAVKQTKPTPKAARGSGGSGGAAKSGAGSVGAATSGAGATTSGASPGANADAAKPKK